MWDVMSMDKEIPWCFSGKLPGGFQLFMKIYLGATAPLFIGSSATCSRGFFDLFYGFFLFYSAHGAAFVSSSATGSWCLCNFLGAHGTGLIGRSTTGAGGGAGHPRTTNQACYADACQDFFQMIFAHVMPPSCLRLLENKRVLIIFLIKKL